MGDSPHDLDFRRRVGDDYVIFIPAGKWHNLINTGRLPVALLHLCAPEHPHGTVHETRKTPQNTINNCKLSRIDGMKSIGAMMCSSLHIMALSLDWASWI